MCTANRLFISNGDDHCLSPCASLAAGVAGLLDTASQTLKEIVNRNHTHDDPLDRMLVAPFINVIGALATNLTNTVTDSAMLGIVAGSINNTVSGTIQTFQIVQNLLAPGTTTLTAPVIAKLESILPTAQQLVTCTGNQTSCVGLTQLYRNFANAALTAVANITTPLPDTNLPVIGGPSKTVLDLLQTELNNVDTALNTGNYTLIAPAADLINGIIGTTAGNEAVFEPVGGILKVLITTINGILKCYGLTPINEYTTDGARLSGLIANAITFIQSNIGAIPVIGPLIINPILETLKLLANDLQNGAGTAIGGILAVFDGFLQAVNLSSPGDQTSSIRVFLDLLLNPVGIIAVPGNYGVQSSPCVGIIEIVRFLANAAINAIAQIPLIDAVVKSTLPPLINGILDAISSGTVPLIQAAYDLLVTPISIVTSLPLIGNIAIPLKIFLNAVKKLLIYLIASPSLKEIPLISVSIPIPLVAS
ncbi:hypothetical protein BC939DRAFT_444205, partial [Gamsiella multidivaricata]|uniref:uncharacterized protein n=1 Tax=Gamsiella multidivaricata TaxID=101098 RepID=UPI002220BC5C